MGFVNQRKFVGRIVVLAQVPEGLQLHDLVDALHLLSKKLGRASEGVEDLVFPDDAGLGLSVLKLRAEAYSSLSIHLSVLKQQRTQASVYTSKIQNCLQVFSNYLVRG